MEHYCTKGVEELRLLCKEAGIKGYSQCTKRDLAVLLINDRDMKRYAKMQAEKQQEKQQEVAKPIIAKPIVAKPIVAKPISFFRSFC